jgi:hypothetical protein
MVPERVKQGVIEFPRDDWLDLCGYGVLNSWVKQKPVMVGGKRDSEGIYEEAI